MMGKRRSGPEKLPPPSLTVSRADAEERISNQISKGSELVLAVCDGHIASSADLEVFSRQRRSWHDFNMELLTRLFDNSATADEYGRTPGVYIVGSTTLQEDIRELIEFVNEHIHRLESIRGRLPLIPEPKSDAPVVPASKPISAGCNIFVVHGHDNAAKDAVARLLTKLTLNPIILSEQPNLGRTLIDKFEHNAADVGFAVVLLTADDYGQSRKMIDDGEFKKDRFEMRARPNVVFEMGFSIGALKRARVCLLLKHGTAKPSDIEGLVYVPMDEHDAWHLQLARESKASGIPIDLNLLT